jgi:hypothetical protein
VRKKRARNKKEQSSFLDELDVASPPEPSMNQNFRYAHEELAVLSNIGRVFINVAMDQVGGGSPVSWSKFLKDRTSHKNISSVSEIENYLSAKLFARKKSPRKTGD